MRCAPPRKARRATSTSGSSGCGSSARPASPDQELSERKDELENAILAARVTFQGEELPLRTAQAKLAVLPDYAERDELGELQADASAEFNEGRRELIRDENALAGELSGHHGSGRPQRRGEGHLAPRPCGTAQARERRER